jgi:hypothetical protein
MMRAAPVQLQWLFPTVAAYHQRCSASAWPTHGHADDGGGVVSAASGHSVAHMTG